MKKQLTNSSQNLTLAGCDGTWMGDPGHFRRPSRRNFLYVGMIGGLGLTLGDFFRMQNIAKAAGGPLTEAAKAPAFFAGAVSSSMDCSNMVPK